MMPETSSPNSAVAAHSKFYYGWVIVAACTLMIAITYGLMYSYSVFFKPLADYFSWDRATVSLVYSSSLIIRGAISIGVGWLADKYGPKKILVFCGFMIGLGLVLSSQVHTLWQLFITYAVLEATGLSGAFGVGTAMVSRWFTKNRGLALGIVSTGSGLGTLFIVPGAERLVNAVQWSQAFWICGIAGGTAMIVLALLLRAPPRSTSEAINPVSEVKNGPVTPTAQTDFTLWKALTDSRMLMLMAALIFFFFSIQIIMVHLVNYATDIKIDPLVAASFISIIGAVSIAGRLITGLGADKFGIHNTLMLTPAFLVIAFVFLIFTKSLWSFYVFAVLFALPYGGEIPQIPMFIGKYFGTKAMATLVGVSIFAMNIGGALGPWLAGTIYDNTKSYQWAFIIGALSGVVSFILILILNIQYRRTQQR